MPNNRQLICLLLLFLFTSGLFALGKLRVESATERPVTEMNLVTIDADGQYAPVLLIKTRLQGIGFQNVGRPTKHPAQYIPGEHYYKFYTNTNQRLIRLTHPDYEPLDIYLLNDHDLYMDSQRVYEIVLSNKPERKEVQLVVISNPADAEKWLNDKLLGTGENFTIEQGSYTIEVKKKGMTSFRKEFTAENAVTTIKDIRLVPAMPAVVEINTTPEGATVYLNNLRFGTTPIESFYDAGTYPIKIERENYETIETTITIKDPETRENYVMTDIRAVLTIKTHSNATVMFNDESHKGGVSEYKISPQILKITVTMPKAETIERMITLSPKSIETMEIYPEIDKGTIQIITIPTTASFELKGDAGEYYSGNGRGTYTDIPVGVYELTAQNKGFKTYKEKITLKKNDVEQKQIKMEEGSDVPDNLIFVKGGTFQMGSNDGESDEKPVHSVTVSDLYIGKHEVIQKEWKEIMGNNPSSFKGDNLPVESVSWYDVVEFCNKKSQKEGLTPCYSGSGDNITCDWNANGYRLPTEAEWDFAARGGSTGSPTEYAGSKNIEEVAWYDGNSGSKTHDVGGKKPNELGIYDMSGNVWEWCWDWYGSYSSDSQTNPRGASSGSFRVLHGGGWDSSTGCCRVAYRGLNDPNYSYNYSGFRLLQSVE